MQLHTLIPQTTLDRDRNELTFHVAHDVLNITGLGDIQTAGDLSVGNGKFTVEDGVVTTQNMNVVNSLDVRGTVVVEDSLTIGSGFALTPEGMTIDTARHSGPLLELRSSQKNFHGSFLEINSLTSGETPANSSMIRTAVDGLTTFDLKTNGHLIVNGIQMKSGGLVVSSGGLEVESGGLRVRGGITLESGQLNLKDKTEMKLSSLILENHQSQNSILQINNYNAHYVGPIISLNNNSEGDGQLDSDGNIVSAGSMKLHKQLISEGGLHVSGIFSLDPYQVLASDEIILPPNRAFIEVLNDHKESLNRVYLPKLGDDKTVSESLTPGQVLVLRNLDETSLKVVSTNHHNHATRTIQIPTDVTVILIFNGYDWLDIQSLSTSVDRLKNIQELTFQNDVDVGNFTITAGGYRMLGINKGEVLVGGIGGSLKGRKGLTYSNGVLSTQGLKAQSLESDLDGNKKTIT